MTRIVFGTIPDELVTLVSEHLATMTLGEEGERATPVNTEGDMEELEDLDDDDLMSGLPSPNTLLRQMGEAMRGQPDPIQALLNAPVLPTPGREVPPGVNTVNANASGTAAAATTQGAVVPSEDPSAILTYLRSLEVDRSMKFDGVHHSSGESIQVRWKRALSTVNGWSALSGFCSDRAKIMFLGKQLTGKAFELYNAKLGRVASANADNPTAPAIPTYQQMVEELETLTLGQRKSYIDLTTDIFHVKLLDLANKLPSNPRPTLAQVWHDFTGMIKERDELGAPFDQGTVIWLYLNCLPAVMQEKLRHLQDAKGELKDPWDPVTLANSILNLSDVFDAELRRRRADDKPQHKPQGQGSGPSGSKSGAGPSKGHNSNKRKHGQGSGSGGGSSSKFPHLQSGTVPTATYHPATHGWWIRNMSQDRMKELKKKELCLLCESDKHMLVDCPKKEQEFAAGNFYAFERSKKRQK